jgi:hypothetical protein
MDTCPLDMELAIRIVNATPKPTFVITNLDAVRNLRKRQGVSCKFHLIGRGYITYTQLSAGDYTTHHHQYTG